MHRQTKQVELNNLQNMKDNFECLRTTVSCSSTPIDVTTIGRHTHTIPKHPPSHSYEAEPVFENDDYVISLKSGKMYDTKSFLNVEHDFLNKICQCIISHFSGHDIELFKAGQSDMLKEKILEFLKED